jgi:phenylalanyl-tRNA synthetase alpha chain
MIEGLEARLNQIRQDISREIESCRGYDDLSLLYSRYLGRKGVLRGLFAQLAELSIEEKRILGPILNRFKEELSTRLKEREAYLSSLGGKTLQVFDPTLPGWKINAGRRHPVYLTMDQIKDIFKRLGFDIVTGPEIEYEYNNFEALNISADHPSHDALDTFYIERDILLRSHTSPVQIRAMKRLKPPLRLIAPGRAFRPDDPDPSHAPMFHQVEGLMVGEDVTFAHLKGILELFAREMFGPQTQMRFRPSYFPFVEPGAEVDISCVLCHGKGCSACKMSGWMEILGAGMVHPKVFQNVGYDPERYTGFAFGMGVERIAMLKYTIHDIRLFTENHFAFLQQF